MVMIRGAKGVYQLNLADGWIIGNPDQKAPEWDKHFTLIQEEEILADGNVVIETVGGVNAENYAKISVENILKQVSGELLSLRQITVSNINAYEAKMYLDLPNIGTTYCIQRIVIIGGVAYIVTCRTLLTNQERVKVFLTNLLNSFQVFPEVQRKIEVQRLQYKKYLRPWVVGSFVSFCLKGSTANFFIDTGYHWIDVLIILSPVGAFIGVVLGYLIIRIAGAVIEAIGEQCGIELKINAKSIIFGKRYW